MFKKTKTPTALEETMEAVHEVMRELDPFSEEYSACADQLVKLSAIKDPQSKTGVSPDVAVTAAANLLGIGMIIHHERAGIIASKALGFVMKLR